MSILNYFRKPPSPDRNFDEKSAQRRQLQFKQKGRGRAGSKIGPRKREGREQ
jgi:hypothetical protein